MYNNTKAALRCTQIKLWPPRQFKKQFVPRQIILIGCGSLAECTGKDLKIMFSEAENPG